MASRVEEEAILTLLQKLDLLISRSFDPFSPFFPSACRKVLRHFNHSDDLELLKLSKQTLLRSAHGACGLTGAEHWSHTMDCQTCSLRMTRLLLGFVLSFEK